MAALLTSRIADDSGDNELGLALDADGWPLPNVANAEKIIAARCPREGRRSKIVDELQAWLCIRKIAAHALLEEIDPRELTDAEQRESDGEMAAEATRD